MNNLTVMNISNNWISALFAAGQALHEREESWAQRLGGFSDRDWECLQDAWLEFGQAPIDVMIGMHYSITAQLPDGKIIELNGTSDEVYDGLIEIAEQHYKTTYGFVSSDVDDTAHDALYNHFNEYEASAWRQQRPICVN